MKQLDDMVRNPASYFNLPHDVVEADDLTREEKIRILRSWEYDARELEVAQEENMMGEAPDLLRRVKKALAELDDIDHSREASGTKHGG